MSRTNKAFRRLAVAAVAVAAFQASLAQAITITASAPPTVPVLPGHTLEDFEDVNLQTGLLVSMDATVAPGSFAPTSTLPSFSLNAGMAPDHDDWDGANSLWNQINAATNDANVVMSFFGSDVNSVGFGLSGVQAETHQVIVTDRNNAIVSQVLNSAVFPGFTNQGGLDRDFYLRVTSDVPIVSIEIRQGVGDAIGIDALQFGLVPEPASAMLGLLGLIGLGFTRRRYP